MAEEEDPPPRNHFPELNKWGAFSSAPGISLSDLNSVGSNHDLFKKTVHVLL